MAHEASQNGKVESKINGLAKSLKRLDFIDDSDIK